MSATTSPPTSTPPYGYDVIENAPHAGRHRRTYRGRAERALERVRGQNDDDPGTVAHGGHTPSPGLPRLSIAVAVPFGRLQPLPAAAKPHELYTVDTSLTGYNPMSEKYNAAVRITSNPCPHVTYDDTLSNIAKDADDALAQAHDQLAKIEQDIRKSADECPKH